MQIKQEVTKPNETKTLATSKQFSHNSLSEHAGTSLVNSASLSHISIAMAQC